MLLPSSPQEPNLSPEAFKWLIMSLQGMGKSSLLASVEDIIIVDPDKGCRALPGYVVDVASWQDCLELKRLLKKEVESGSCKYKWLGLDILNVTYEYAYVYMCSQMGVKHPSDVDGGKGYGKGWNRITQEFTMWVRELSNLLPTIATCHVNMTEVTVRGIKFNRFIPAFAGGGARGTYQKAMEIFDIIGFMALETQEHIDEKDIRKIVQPDVPIVDKPAIKREATEVRVIHFQPSQYWEAEDTSRQLPPKVTLPSDWKEDWNTILSHWGKED